MAAAGTFPKPRRLSYKVSVWIEQEVLDWQQRQLEASAPA